MRKFGSHFARKFAIFDFSVRFIVRLTERQQSLVTSRVLFVRREIGADIPCFKNSVFFLERLQQRIHIGSNFVNFLNVALQLRGGGMLDCCHSVRVIGYGELLPTRDERVHAIPGLFRHTPYRAAKYCLRN